MIRATYIGQEHPSLVGETALAMHSYQGEPAPEGFLFLQFDNLALELDGVNLAHGWHAFKRDLLEVKRSDFQQDFSLDTLEVGQ